MLMHLSLVHCPLRAQVPSTPTPEERLCAFRAVFSPMPGNNIFHFPMRGGTSPASHPAPARAPKAGIFNPYAVEMATWGE